MENNPQTILNKTRRQTSLIGFSLTFLVVYGFVMFVAFICNGRELVKMPLMYYAAFAPVLYCVFCLISAWGLIPKKMMKTAGIIVHLAALPCIFASFMGLGILLPGIAYLWFKFYQSQNMADEQNETL